MIAHKSLDRVLSSSTKGSVHAFNKNYCSLGLGRGNRLFNICIQLGRPRAAWLLVKGHDDFEMYCLAFWRPDARKLLRVGKRLCTSVRSVARRGRTWHRYDR